MSLHLNRNPSRKKWPGLTQVLLIAILLSACLEANPVPSPLPETAKPGLTQAIPTGTQSTPFQPQDTPAPAKTTLTPTQTTQTTELTGLYPEGLQGQTIQFWHARSGEAGKVWENLAAEFNASNEWGIQVQASEVGNYDQLDTRLNSAVESGALPDLVTALTYQAAAWEASGEGEAQENGSSESQPGGTATTSPVPSPTTSAAAATSTPFKRANPPKLLANLNDYVNDPTWGLKPGEQADFYPAFWEANALDGKRLGLPAIYSPQVIYYNQSWAEELGFQEPPQTPEQFQEQACAAAQANKAEAGSPNDGSGGLIISTQPESAAGWLESFGGAFTRTDGSGYQFNTPQVEAAFRFLRGLYDAGCAWLPESDSPENDFANRRGLFATASLAALPDQFEAMKQAGNQDRWTVLAFPSPNEEPAISAFGPSYVILKTTPERQLAAWLFARWLSQPDHQAVLALASGDLPTRQSAIQQLSAQSSSTAQWHAALTLSGYARPEPPYASWTTVRWALSDAFTQLFRYYFKADGIPSLVKLLDETAQELFEQSSQE